MSYAGNLGANMKLNFAKMPFLPIVMGLVGASPMTKTFLDNGMHIYDQEDIWYAQTFISHFVAYLTLVLAGTIDSLNGAVIPTNKTTTTAILKTRL